MVRHKTRPLRSLAPEETGCIASIAAAAVAGTDAPADVNASSSPSLTTSPAASQQVKAARSPMLASFWPTPSSSSTTSSLSTPPSSTAASSSNGNASQHPPAGKMAKPNNGVAGSSNGSDRSSSTMSNGSRSNGVGSALKHESSFDESDDEDTEDVDYYRHPLSRMHGMPAFSDLQVTITKAIVKRSGKKHGYASFEDILEFLTKKWNTLRRKDGSHYSSASTYIKRAVQANLRSTANGIPLFKMDPTRDGYWAVCQITDVTKPAAFKPSKDDEELWAIMNESPSPQPNSSAPPPPPRPVVELTKEELQFYESAKSRMTALQRTISECIVQSGGSCHFEFILDTVQKSWVDIKNEDNLPRVANMKKLVGACVARDRGEDSKALFMRDHNAESSGYWKLGLSNPYARIAGLAYESDEKENGAPSAPPPTSENGSSSSSSSSSRRNAPLTHLQELIIDAIAVNGEAADLDTICAYIKERWQGLLRRDGTPYAADIRKAVQSSLSNASSPSPIFVKLAETDQVMWGLTARGKSFLRERQRKQTEAMEADDDDSEGSSSPLLDGDGSLTNGNGHSNGAKHDQPKKKRRKKSQFSGIQQMIAEIMERNGGSAPFEMILTECQKRWRTLRKRDGTPYNADPKRSINASLTKTPDYGQVFERDPNRDGYWRLTSDAQVMWDQLKKSPITSVSPLVGTTAAPVIMPRMLVMPRVGVVVNPIPGVLPDQEARLSEELAAQKKYDDELQRKRERERERREKKRQEREALKSEDADSDTTSELRGFATREDNFMAEDDEDESYEVQKRRKRPRRDEAEREDLAEEEEELEYGEGSGEAPKLGTMQALVIRTIQKHGGSCSFKTIFDALCEKVEKDKGLMSAVNWARVHRSNFLIGSEEEDKCNTKIFACDEQDNWSVCDSKLTEWVVAHKKKRTKLDKPAIKKKRADE